jgi:hypothetical protein
MSSPTPNLPLDLTAAALTNKIVGEAHTVNGTVGRTIATNYGGFYTESLIVRNADTLVVLQPGLHYVAIHLNKQGSLASGKEVCGVINFLNNYNGDVLIDYQAIGGQYSGNVDAIRQLIDSIAQDERPVTWGSILFAPDQFTPAAHLHHLKELFGWEGVITLLDEIRNNILVGDQGARDAMYKWLEYQLGLQQEAIDVAIAAIPAAIAGKLDKAQNLLDLPNKKTARQNLGVEQFMPRAIARFKGRGTTGDTNTDRVRVLYNFSIPANSNVMTLTRSVTTPIVGAQTVSPTTGDPGSYPNNPLSLGNEGTANIASFRTGHRVAVYRITGSTLPTTTPISPRVEGTVTSYNVTNNFAGTTTYTLTMTSPDIVAQASARSGVCIMSVMRLLPGSYNVDNVIYRGQGRYMVNFTQNAFNEDAGSAFRDRWAIPTMIRLNPQETGQNRGHLMELERDYSGTTLNSNPAPQWAALTCNFVDNNDLVDMYKGGAMFYESI